MYVTETKDNLIYPFQFVRNYSTFIFDVTWTIEIDNCQLFSYIPTGFNLF